MKQHFFVNGRRRRSKFLGENTIILECHVDFDDWKGVVLSLSTAFELDEVM